MVVPWCIHACPPIPDISPIAIITSLVGLIKSTESPFQTTHPQKHFVQLNIIPYQYETTLFEPIVIILMFEPH